MGTPGTLVSRNIDPRGCVQCMGKIVDRHLTAADGAVKREPAAVGVRLCAAVLLWALAGTATAYVQDIEFERQLHASDARGLARLPAARFNDGVAGFFRVHGLYVVPYTEMAWCQDRARGVLPPGCYVEFFFQLKGYRPREAGGSPCGLIGRWHRAPGSNAYVPTAGAVYSAAMAAGDWQKVMTALTEPSNPSQLNDSRRREECTS